MEKGRSWKCYKKSFKSLTSGLGACVPAAVIKKKITVKEMRISSEGLSMWLLAPDGSFPVSVFVLQKRKTTYYQEIHIEIDLSTKWTKLNRKYWP